MVNEQEILSVKQRFGIIGTSPSLNHAIQVAIQVAATDMTVLITGESGTGKESFSKIIHSLSHRKHGNFIAVNCGAIPEGTIDSELFGHEKGAFTGASDSRKGYFEVTNEGTIFLDEIGEMPLSTQSRLLRVLEYGEFIRVGSSKVQKTNVRVVAATNRNLFREVEKGKFREDLYYRLNTVPIFVPPLRDRGSDIELLFRKFASDFADKYRVTPVKLTDEAKPALSNYRWPGNIRQLRNITEQISVLETDRIIDAETLENYLPPEQSSPPALYKKDRNNKEDQQFSERDILYKILFDMKKDMNELKQLIFEILHGKNGADVIQDHKDLFQEVSNDFSEEPLRRKLLLDQPKEQKPTNRIELEKYQDVEPEETLSLEEKEKELIKKALIKNNNKRKYAARDLGISERTLYRKIKQYNLENI